MGGVPPRARVPGWRAALCAALAAHALLLFVHLTGTPPDPSRAPHVRFPLVPLADRADVQVMRYVPPPARRKAKPAGPPRANPTVTPESERPLYVPPEAPAPLIAERAPEPTTPPAAGEGSRLAPAIGAGVLWVRPLPLPPAELAARLRPKSHVELVDSAVASIVQQYLDSLARDPAAHLPATPAWVGKIGGKEFGLDGKNIIVAGLRIPAAILGFLPLSLGGRIDHDGAQRRLNDMRQDLLRAAARAENYAQFKANIKEIRERKQAEKDFERNQRSLPPALRDSLEVTQ